MSESLSQTVERADSFNPANRDIVGPLVDSGTVLGFDTTVRETVVFIDGPNNQNLIMTDRATELIDNPSILTEEQKAENKRQAAIPVPLKDSYPGYNPVATRKEKSYPSTDEPVSLVDRDLMKKLNSQDAQQIPPSQRAAAQKNAGRVIIKQPANEEQKVAAD